MTDKNKENSILSSEEIERIKAEETLRNEIRQEFKTKEKKVEFNRYKRARKAHEKDLKRGCIITTIILIITAIFLFIGLIFM